AAAVDADLSVAHFAGEPERSPVGGADPCPVLDSAAADAAELVVVDIGAVGDEQDDRRAVDVELDGDLARLELGQEQVEHYAAAAGADVEAAGARPRAEPADRAVIGPDFLAVVGECGHEFSPLRIRGPVA